MANDYFCNDSLRDIEGGSPHKALKMTLIHRTIASAENLTIDIFQA